MKFELINNRYFDFLSPKRLIFLQPGEKARVSNDNQSQNPPAKPNAKVSIPFTGKDFQHHQDRYDAHVKHLPANVSAKKRAEFAKELAKYKADYNNEVTNHEANGTENPEHAAAKAVHGKVTQLMDRIRTHITDKAKIAQLDARFRKTASSSADRSANKPAQVKNRPDKVVAKLRLNDVLGRISIKEVGEVMELMVDYLKTILKPEDYKKFKKEVDATVRLTKDPALNAKAFNVLLATLRKYAPNLKHDFNSLAKASFKAALAKYKKSKLSIDQRSYRATLAFYKKVLGRPSQNASRPTSKPASKPAKRPMNPVTIEHFLQLDVKDLLTIEKTFVKLLTEDYEGFIKSFNLPKEKHTQLLALKKPLQAYAKEVGKLLPLIKKGNVDEFAKKYGANFKKHEKVLMKFWEVFGDKLPTIEHLLKVIGKHISKSKNIAEISAFKDVTARLRLKANPVLKKYQVAADYLAKRFGITDEGGKRIITAIIPQLNLTPAQFNQITKYNTLELDKKQKKILKRELPDLLGDVDRNEYKDLNEFMSRDSKLSEFFDSFDDPAFKILSMRFTIKKSKEGKLQFIKNGKVVLTPSSPRDLLKKSSDGKTYVLFPKIIGAAFEGYLNGTVKKESLIKILDKQSKRHEAYRALQKGLLSKESLTKATGPLGGLTMILQLIKKLKEAFKTGKYEELNDYLLAWNQSKHPAALDRMIKESEQSYENAVANRVPAAKARELLLAYANPGKNSQDANGLLTQTSGFVPNLPTSRFRSRLRPAIVKHLQNRTGLSDIQIKKRNGIFQIVGSRAGKRYAIEVDLGNGKQERMQLVELTKGKDSKGKTRIKRNEVVGFASTAKVKLDLNDKNIKLFDQLIKLKKPAKSSQNLASKKRPNPTRPAVQNTNPKKAPVKVAQKPSVAPAQPAQKVVKKPVKPKKRGQA